MTDHKTVQEEEARKNFKPRHGEAVLVAPHIERVVANNASPFTFTGTNSYVIGDDQAVFLLDPGPSVEKAPGHIEALLRAVSGRRVEAILLTHTHRDHSDGVSPLLQKLDAPLWGYGENFATRPLYEGEVNPLANSNSDDLKFDRLLRHEDVLSLASLQLQVVYTPGHAENHISFALLDTPYLFSGDHLMGWSTSLVAPPDGHMGHYLASMDTLLARSEHVYFPAHGGRILDAHQTVRATKNHRLMREQAVLGHFNKGLRDPMDIADAVYGHKVPALRAAASWTVQAHLDHLAEEGVITL